MDLDAFGKCKSTFSGKTVLLVGNGPSAKDLANLARSYDRIATVNAGLYILAQEGLQASFLWIQDGRVFKDKSDKVMPYLNPQVQVGLPVHGRTPPELLNRPLLRFNNLGNHGFSRDPRIGIFTGYTALYGLMQLLCWCRPTKMGFIGMDLDYSFDNTRACQKKRGLDVDLHVNDLQISYTLNGLETLKSQSIVTQIHSKSNVLSVATTTITSPDS